MKSNTLHDIVWSLIISSSYTLIRYLLFIAGVIRNAPLAGWFIQTLIVAGELFLLSQIIRVFHALYYTTLFYLYPTFQDAHNKTGVSWKDYKRINKNIGKWEWLKEYNKSLRK